MYTIYSKELLQPMFYNTIPPGIKINLQLKIEKQN